MAAKTPLEVVEAYNYELWNRQNYDLGEEIIADHVVRHYPGSVQTLSKEEALQRVKHAYAEVFSSIKFTLPKTIVEGEYVTIVWQMEATTKEAEEFVYGSIEVFRVVDGKICEFWNPINADEPNGLWG